MTSSINLDGKITVSLAALVGAVVVIVGAVAAGSGFLAVKMDTLSRVVVETGNNTARITMLENEMRDAKAITADNNRILRERYGR